MRVVELEGLGPAGWERLIDGEREPWGGIGERLHWQPKTRTVGVLDEDGALVATGGLLVASVTAGDARFAVAGLGGVFVTRRARGRGLATRVIGRLLEIAGELGPQRAMLFCMPSRVALYERFGFTELGRPVRATQPAGPISVPMRAMWRELSPGAGWPPGEVEVLGEPF